MSRPRWNVWIMGMVVALAGPSVWADEGDEPQPAAPSSGVVEPATDEPMPDNVVEPGAAEQDPPDRPDRRPGRRAATRNENQGNQKLRMLESFRDEVIRTLRLEDEAADLVRDLFAEHLEYLKEQSVDSAESRRQQSEEIRGVVEEMKAARQNGDIEEMHRLRERLKELRRSSSEVDLEHEELFDALREGFDDEQIVVFDRLAEQFETRLQGPNRRDDGVSRMRRALSSLELMPEQRLQTRRLLAEVGRDIRAARGDAERVKDLEDRLHDALLDELDDAQAERFETMLEQLAARDKHPGRNPRDVRPLGSSADPSVPVVDPEMDEAHEEEGGEMGDGSTPE